MDKWRVFGVGVVVAACCVSLAACDGDAGPLVTEPPPGTVTGTASPGSTPVVTATPAATPTATAWLLEQLPADALTDDVEGATATAEFFLEQYAPMFHTGDTSLWQALSGPECGYCADALANAEEVAARGWTAEGGEITIDTGSMRATEQADNEIVITLDAVTADAVLLADGVEQSREVGTTAAFTVGLAYRGQHWFIVGVVSESR